MFLCGDFYWICIKQGRQFYEQRPYKPQDTEENREINQIGHRFSQIHTVNNLLLNYKNLCLPVCQQAGMCLNLIFLFFLCVLCELCGKYL